MSEQEKNPLAIATNKVIAIGSLTEKATQTNKSERLPVLQREVPATVQVYLDGKIDNWFVKTDGSGVVFIMNVNTIEEAQAILEALPLGQAGFMKFNLIPVGPLSPLRLLLN
ncbi:hypothetical protein SNE25_30275 [Mucilaginibacter sabulilitoris]|uniref:Muconolactone isomerase domain-containing protein n=1 Tax=Mucilaginibacter sabulilitoris TaxID=1173583 RepID=A0ABZ0TN38_9SPHI|nr:hypothetical protein [Mucilaginibacter sabulilitoris]WPU93608.1 hypothetical protein SNE25_30275 [Mucilaginibacter sabulilitoris]